MEQVQSNPVRWLVAANLTWLAAGLVAYYTPATLVIGTAVAAVVALPGLLELRSRGKPAEPALAAAVGTWVAMAMLTVLPYIASEDGLSLWSSHGFHGVGVVAASVGFLLWNQAAAKALGHSRRPWIILHLIALAFALYLLPGDATVHEVVLRGESYDMVDLRIGPLVAASASIAWIAALRSPVTSEAGDEEE